MAKIIHIRPTSRDMVKAFADRLCELIKESDDPRAEMCGVESYLDEEGLWYGSLSPDVSPEEFVFNIVEQNPCMQEALSSITIILTPKRIETIGAMAKIAPAQQSRSCYQEAVRPASCRLVSIAFTR